jgi:hypothetical protein
MKVKRYIYTELESALYMNLAGNRKIMAATAAQNAITLKGSTEIVSEFFCNVFIMHIESQ